jgi:glycosyltransferase involved in cell wall biosynthesis
MNIISEIHLKKEHLIIPSTFTDAGYESFVICGRSKIIYNGPVKFFETRNKKKNIFYVILEFLVVLKKFLKEEPDLVMFFQNNAMIPLMVLLYSILRPFGRPIWIVFLDFDVDEKNGRRTIVRKLGWIVNSIFVDYLTYQTLCHKEVLSRYIKNSKMIPLQPSYSSRHYIARKYVDFNRKPKILCVCRVVREKGLEILIRSFSLIKDKFPEWYIKFVGPTIDIKYYGELMDLVTETRLSSSIKFAGNLSDHQLSEEYNSASLFCLPSFSESLGISRFEAAINGIPVVTSDAGCAKDMMNFGMLVFKRGDIKALSNILCDLMENEELRVSISNKQLKHVKSLEENVLELIRIMNSH